MVDSGQTLFDRLNFGLQRTLMRKRGDGWHLETMDVNSFSRVIFVHQVIGDDDAGGREFHPLRNSIFPFRYNRTNRMMRMFLG